MLRARVCVWRGGGLRGKEGKSFLEGSRGSCGMLEKRGDTVPGKVWGKENRWVRKEPSSRQGDCDEGGYKRWRWADRSLNQEPLEGVKSHSMPMSQCPLPSGPSPGLSRGPSGTRPGWRPCPGGRALGAAGPAWRPPARSTSFPPQGSALPSSLLTEGAVRRLMLSPSSPG